MTQQPLTVPLVEWAVSSQNDTAVTFCSTDSRMSSQQSEWQSLTVPLTAAWEVSSQNDSNLLFHWQQNEQSAVRMTVTHCSTDSSMRSHQSEWQSLTVPLTAERAVRSQNDNHLLFHWQQNKQSAVKMTEQSLTVPLTAELTINSMNDRAVTYCSTESRMSSQQSEWQSFTVPLITEWGVSSQNEQNNHLLFQWLQNEQSARQSSHLPFNDCKVNSQQSERQSSH